MRNFTKPSPTVLLILLGVAALGIVVACGIKPAVEEKPPNGTISGLILLPNGNPAPGVTVKVVAPLAGGGPGNPRDRTINSTRTDAQGRYTIDVRPGFFKVVAKKLGAQGQADVEVIAGTKIEVDVMMEKVGK